MRAKVPISFAGNPAGLVMLLGGLLSEEDPLRGNVPERRALVNAIVADFRKAFQDLRFDLRPEFRIVNAQAITLGDERCVIIYGGLAYHPKLRSDSLSFVLLHETGHHLASGRRLPFYKSMACECASDYWAATQGADMLKRSSGRDVNLGLAVEELGQILEIERQQPVGCVESCWNQNWSLRRRAIIQRTALDLGADCRVVD
jgi:hypothetical protein